MRITICAVGRLRAGPEKTLFDTYVHRVDRTGRALGLGPVAMREVEARKTGGMAEEARLLVAACPDAALRVVLDERGTQLSSPQFADVLAQARDDGRRDLAVLIGGADGVTADLRAGADRVLSFGPMVWPHMLVRVMLAEQMYRAAAILAGTPYHRV